MGRSDCLPLMAQHLRYPCLREAFQLRPSPGPYLRAIAPHAEIVGQNQAIESHAAAQHSVEHLSAKEKRAVSGSIRGSRMCAVMISGTPAATAAAKGKRARRTRVALIVPANTGKSWCGSTRGVAVTGKVFRAREHAARARNPRSNATPILATSFASAPKLRSFVTGLFRIYVEVQHRREI